MASLKNIDAFGRVTIENISANSTITKNGVQVATGITGTWTDNRPQKNYVKVTSSASSFTFTGVEFAIIGRQTNAILDWTVTIQGSEFYGQYGVSVDFRGMTVYPRDNQILWGVGGLPDDVYTVTVTANNSYALSNIQGRYESNLSLSYGDSVTYNVGGTEIVVTPRPNRANAKVSILNRWKAGYTANRTTFLAGMVVDSYLNEYIASVAGAYAMTSDSALPTVASEMFARLQEISGNGIIYGHYYDAEYDESAASLTENGRSGYSLWYAWKVFGVQAYLDYADACVSFLVNDWQKSSGIWCFQSRAGHDYNPSAFGTMLAWGNHISAAALSCAVLYNEPESIHYHSQVVYDVMMANVQYALNSHYNAVDGSLNWVTSGIPDRLYGMFAWLHYKYFQQHFDFESAKVENVRQWLNNLGTVEPFFSQDIVYETASAEWIYLRLISENGQAGDDFIDMLHSAAFDNVNADEGVLDYDPRGFATSSANLDPLAISYSMFYAPQFFELLGRDATGKYTVGADISPGSAVGHVDPMSAIYGGYAQGVLGMMIAVGHIDPMEAIYSEISYNGFKDKDGNSISIFFWNGSQLEPLNLNHQ